VCLDRLAIDKKKKRIITSLLVNGSFKDRVTHLEYVRTSRRLDQAIKDNPLVGNILEHELDKIIINAKKLLALDF